MAPTIRKIEPLRNVTNKLDCCSIKKRGLGKEEEVLYKCQVTNDSTEISMVHKYHKQVFAYYCSIDKPSDYINTEVTWKMRSLLVDWVINIHEKLNMCADTLYYSVNLVDKFLCVRSVPTNKLQLVGITALVIACKFEEVVCPSLETFVMLCDRTLMDDDIRKAEKYMLHTLNYNIKYVSPLNFLRQCSKANNYEINSRMIGKYLLELTLLYIEFLPFKSSVRAAAAMYLARKMTKQDGCKNLFFIYAGHSKHDIKECYNQFLKIISQPIEYENIQNKYLSAKTFRVAKYVKQYLKDVSNSL